MEQKEFLEKVKDFSDGMKNQVPEKCSLVVVCDNGEEGFAAIVGESDRIAKAILSIMAKSDSITDDMVRIMGDFSEHQRQVADRSQGVES